MCAGVGRGQLLITFKQSKSNHKRLIQELCKQLDEFTDCRCATLNANDLPSYSMCNNMGFNTRPFSAACQLRFHLFSKTCITQMELWWMSDNCPKTQNVFSCFDVLQEGRSQAGRYKADSQETSLWHVLFCRINSSTFESPFKMPPCFGRWPRDIPKPLTWCTLGRFLCESLFVKL